MNAEFELEIAKDYLIMAHEDLVEETKTRSKVSQKALENLANCTRELCTVINRSAFRNEEIFPNMSKLSIHKVDTDIVVENTDGTTRPASAFEIAYFYTTQNNQKPTKKE